MRGIVCAVVENWADGRLQVGNVEITVTEMSLSGHTGRLRSLEGE